MQHSVDLLLCGKRKVEGLGVEVLDHALREGLVVYLIEPHRPIWISGNVLN